MTEANTNGAVSAETNVADVAEAKKTPQEIFAERWAKRDRAIARVTDDQAAFMDFIGATFDESNPYKDWASPNAAKLGANATFAIVLCEETGENRLIVVAGKEAMFGTGGDEIVKETAYKLILNKAVAIASKADTTVDMFATVGGFLKAKFNLDAFKAFAKQIVAVLHARGLKSITVPTLKTALANAAFAKAQFPMVQPEQWNTIFAIFTKNAEDTNMDTSIFAHWAKTRDNMTDTGADLGDFSFDSIMAEMEEEDEGSDANAGDHDPVTAATAG